MSVLLAINFLFSQTLYAQDQFQVQDGTHLYTPVKEVNAEHLDEKGTSSEGLPVLFSEGQLPNPLDFWNEGPLSAPTTESLRGGLQADKAISEIASASPVVLPRNDGGYDFDFYSFDQALDLIRPEFAVAIPIVGFISNGLKAKNGAYGF